MLPLLALMWVQDSSRRRALPLETLIYRLEDAAKQAQHAKQEAQRCGALSAAAKADLEAARVGERLGGWVARAKTLHACSRACPSAPLCWPRRYSAFAREQGGRQARWPLPFVW